MAFDIPARCESCGRAIPNPGGMRIGQGVEVTDLTVSIDNRCPFCGGPARFEGRMNVRAGGIEMIEGPEWSWDLVQALGLALRRAVEQPQANLVAPVAEVSPALAENITTAVQVGLDRSPKKSTAKNRRKLTYAVIAFLAKAVFTDYGVAATNLEAVKDAAESALQYVAQHGSVPPTSSW